MLISYSTSCLVCDEVLERGTFPTTTKRLDKESIVAKESGYLRYIDNLVAGASSK